MAATFVRGKFAWCYWTTWIEECRVDPERTLHIEPVGSWDSQAFRVTARNRALLFDCRPHIHFSRRVGLIRLQFCFEKMETTHTGLHIDGRKLDKSDFDIMDAERHPAWKPPSHRSE